MKLLLSTTALLLLTSCARIETAMVQVGMDKVTNPPPTVLPFHDSGPVKFLWFITFGK